jgi:hypothetical protein
MSIVFTDRHRLIRLFVEYLNNEQSLEKILCFYGDGGNGKSSLLKFLREKCCKRFREDNWQQLKAKPDAKLAEYIEKRAASWEFTPVPAMIHDFGQKPIGDNQPQDSFYGLLMLRRNLANAAKEAAKAKKLDYTLRFPLYDFACFYYLHSKGKSEEEMKRLFPSEIADVIAAVTDVILPGAGSISKGILTVRDRYSGSERQVQLFRERLKLTPAQANEIRTFDPDSELINELPRFFAADLKAAMSQPKAPERVVLFFDTHEAFWGQQRNLGEYLFFERDEWLRYLLLKVRQVPGIVTVVAGREEPRWANAPKNRYRIARESLEIKQVEYFSEDDAKDYLKKSGIRDDLLIETVITYSSVNQGSLHPLFVAMCVDLIKQANPPLISSDLPIAVVAEEKPKELRRLILKYAGCQIERIVYALSACRAFNRDLYFHLSNGLQFQSTDADFQIITEFSFVWETKERGQGWYRIHDLIRRFDNEGSNETTRLAHKFLRSYYQQLGGVAEEIYHLACLDWEQGLEKFTEVFDAAEKQGDLELCRTLQEIRAELRFYWGK